jgi:hypothetical protein
MASKVRHATLGELIQETAQITTQVQDEVGSLPLEQLNWRPNAREWSIGLVLEHLLITNGAYFVLVQQILAGRYAPQFWMWRPMAALFGGLLIHALDPANQRRVEAPKRFRPTSSSVTPAIMPTFVQQQHELMGLMQASQSLPVEEIIIRSPAAALITYTLADAYRILVVHEQRHLLQIRQVRQYHQRLIADQPRP